MAKRKTSFFASRTLTLTVLALFSICILGGTAFAKADTGSAHRLRFTYRPLHKLANVSANRIRPASGALTTWSSSFTSGGQSYQYTMVGTNPRTTSVTTTIGVDIVPLIFKFSDGSTASG